MVWSKLITYADTWASSSARTYYTSQGCTFRERHWGRGAFSFIIFCTNWIAWPEAHVTYYSQGNMNYPDGKIMAILVFFFIVFCIQKQKRRKEGRKGGREVKTTSKCAFKSTTKTTCPHTFSRRIQLLRATPPLMWLDGCSRLTLKRYLISYF